MAIEATQRNTVSVGDTEVVYINFGDVLASGETLTGTPTAVEQTTADLTIASVAVTTATYIEPGSGVTVAIGEALTFAVSGGTAANSPYTIRCTATTTSTPTRTLVRDVVLTFS